jgi:hypothetical protein
VRDSASRPIAYFYFRDEPSLRADYLSQEDAKAMAKVFARLSRDE